MYTYYVYTTIFIKGKIYEYLDIVVTTRPYNRDRIINDYKEKYYDKIIKSDRYLIRIVLKLK